MTNEPIIWDLDKAVASLREYAESQGIDYDELCTRAVNNTAPYFLKGRSKELSQAEINFLLEGEK